MPPTPNDKPGPALNETRARQGLRGQHLLWILIGGTVLSLLAMLAAWGLQPGRDSAGRGSEQVSGASFDTPAPPSPTPTNPPNR